MALRAQQHRSCVMIVSPSGLWVRARAGAWVLAVCEDEHADGDAAEDDDHLGGFAVGTQMRGISLFPLVP